MFLNQSLWLVVIFFASFMPLGCAFDGSTQLAGYLVTEESPAQDQLSGPPPNNGSTWIEEDGSLAASTDGGINNSGDALGDSTKNLDGGANPFLDKGLSSRDSKSSRSDVCNPALLPTGTYPCQTEADCPKGVGISKWTCASTAITVCGEISIRKICEEK